jgi:hypothetical protein
MIDHLLVFANEAAARAAVPQFGMVDEDGCWHWNGSNVMPVRAFIPGEYVNHDDGTVTVIRAEVNVPGYRIWVALDAYNATLTGLEIACDRDALNRGKPWLLFSAVPAQGMAMVKLSPMYAGANYQFSNGG